MKFYRNRARSLYARVLFFFLITHVLFSYNFFGEEGTERFKRDFIGGEKTFGLCSVVGFDGMCLWL